MSKKQPDAGYGKTKSNGQSSSYDSTAVASPQATPGGLAGFDFEDYSRQFMQRGAAKALNDAEGYGARVEPILVPLGTTYWKVIGIHHLTPDENGERHNAYIEVLDETGHRVRNEDLHVGSTWEGKTDGPDKPKPLDKPDDEPATDVPIEEKMTVTLWLEVVGPSERVGGLHTRHADEAGPHDSHNRYGHHSYYVVFQRTTAGIDVQQPPDHGGEEPLPTEQFHFYCWPTDHLQLTQRFGENPGLYAEAGFPGHEGVDIVAYENDPVYCVAPGVVTFVYTPEAYAANATAYGVYVSVQHSDGYETLYAHLKEVRVGAGRAVAAGDVLGLADHTGNVRGTTGDHLHLTLRHAGESATGYRNNIIDPMPFLLPFLPPGEGAGPAAPSRYEAVQVVVAKKLGLNCNAPLAPDGSINQRVADPRLISETGVQWVRLNFIVRGFGGPDNERWIATYRRIIDGLRGAGLQIYGLIGAEAVEKDPGDRFRSPPEGKADDEWIQAYALNFRRIVEMFGQDIAIVESFNEPNDWHAGDGNWQQAWIDAGWFAIMLQSVYDAVHDLPVTLVAGPLLSTERGNSAAAYLPKVYQAGIERFGWGRTGIPVPFDGVAFHPYLQGDPPDPQTAIPALYHRYVAEVRAVISRFDAADKPIYLSEMGWQNDENRQGACMETGLTCALDDPTVGLCFWYGMQDDGHEKYGIYREGRLTPDNRKPIFDRFVALATNPRRVPAMRNRSGVTTRIVPPGLALEPSPAAAAAAAPAPAGLPGMEAVSPVAPWMAAALGIVYQTYWLRVSLAANGPDAQQAIQAAADDALSRIQALLAAS